MYGEPLQISSEPSTNLKETCIQHSSSIQFETSVPACSGKSSHLSNLQSQSSVSDQLYDPNRQQTTVKHGSMQLNKIYQTCCIGSVMVSTVHHHAEAWVQSPARAEFNWWKIVPSVLPIHSALMSIMSFHSVGGKIARERISHRPDMLKAKNRFAANTSHHYGSWGYAITFTLLKEEIQFHVPSIKQTDKELEIKMGMFSGGHYCKHHLHTVLFQCQFLHQNYKQY